MIILIGIFISRGTYAQSEEPPPAFPAPPVQNPASPSEYPTPPYQGYSYPPSGYTYKPLPPYRSAHPTAIYGELLGKGLAYGVGIDHNVREWIGFGAAFSYFEPAMFISPYLNLYPVGGARSALLMQLGLQLVNVNDKTSEFLRDMLWPSKGFYPGGQASIGYEFRSSFLFRVAFLILFNEEGVRPWFGLTFGGAF